jgi:hypothetical protein
MSETKLVTVRLEEQVVAALERLAAQMNADHGPELRELGIRRATRSAAARKAIVGYLREHDAEFDAWIRKVIAEI